MSDVLVVGGGIIGASVAFRAAQAGSKVTLIDAKGLGQGASSVGFGVTFASNKNHHEYYKLNVSGMGEHIRLKNELGRAPWLHQVGTIRWDSGRGARDYVGNIVSLQDVVERLRSWGYKTETLPRAELRYLEPDVVMPEDVEEFVYHEDEGYVDPVLAIGTLAGLARDYGATIKTQCAVTGFIMDGDTVKGVKTSTGETLYADTVVLCTGRWTDEVAKLAGIDFPMSPWIGMTLITAPVAARLNSVVSAFGLGGIRPDGAGRILMHNNDLDELVSPDNPNDPSEEVKQRALDLTSQFLPQLKDARIEAARVTIRPVPGGDHNSAIGPAPNVKGLYFVVSHSAINLGPLLGRLAATEILTGKSFERLQEFRPARLISNS